MSVSPGPVWFETEQNVVVVRLDRSPVNAIDLAMIVRLGETLDELSSKRDLRGLVLTGGGANFSAGLDTKAIPAYGVEELRKLSAAINRVVLTLYGFPLPTVAAVRGAALGGGFCLALACDYRICAEQNGRIGLPEVTAGIPYPRAPLDLIMAELEPGLRRRLALQGETFSAETAKAAGLIDELAPDADVGRLAVAAVLRFAHLPGYAAVKHQLRGAILDKMRLHLAGDDPLVNMLLAARQARD